MKKKNDPSVLWGILEVLVALAVFGTLLWIFLSCVKTAAQYAFEAINDGDGVGRVSTCLRAANDAGGQIYADGENDGLRRYVEDEGTPPEWYRPDEEMAVEWFAKDTNVPVKDIGCPDYNAESTLWGWDGHMMTGVELDLFARIFYREFWQSNLTLCEAGCDAMLQLWNLNGGTMFDTLSHVNEDGSYAFSTYPDVWNVEYDPDALAWCRAYCEERFYEGPSWPAQYFRKGQYHDWDEWSPIPAYEIDGIYFSIGR